MFWQFLSLSQSFPVFSCLSEVDKILAVLCRNSLNFGLAHVFLMIRLDYFFLGRILHLIASYLFYFPAAKTNKYHRTNWLNYKKFLTPSFREGMVCFFLGMGSLGCLLSFGVPWLLHHMAISSCTSRFHLGLPLASLLVSNFLPYWLQVHPHLVGAQLKTYYLHRSYWQVSLNPVTGVVNWTWLLWAIIHFPTCHIWVFMQLT